MSRMIFLVLLLVPCMVECRPMRVLMMEGFQEPAWKYRVRSLEEQIEKMRERLWYLRGEAVRAEEESLGAMEEDWERYKRLIGESEDYEWQAKKLEEKLLLFEREKKMIQDQHK